MSRFRKILIIILSIIITLFLFLAWYQYEYSMDVVQPYQINTEHSKQALLIATQGSDFKDAITADLINTYEQDSIFIRIIDVSTLTEIVPEHYDAIVILHTWESWKPPVAVERFMTTQGLNQDHIVVLTTSGNGTYKMETVDAITGESILEQSQSFSNQILERLNPLLSH